MHAKKNPSLILCSSSPARRALLQRLLIPFTVVTPNIDETPLPNEQPEALVSRLAREKAMVFSSQYAEGILIGSDQVGMIDGIILGKPHTYENACAQLRAKSGKRITFYTGLYVYNIATRAAQSALETYEVYFKDLTDDDIHRYLAKEKPFNCAGSCQVEGLGIALITKMLGKDHTALIGLPLIALVAALKKLGFDIFADS